MSIFITLTNSGYINYTLNCLESLKNIKSDLVLKSYCIGKEGTDILKKKGYICELIDDEQNTNFQTFRTGNWSNITQKKFKIIHENLMKHDFVLFTDGDIVFENECFYKYLLENIGDNDMLIQNDTLENNQFNLCCSGFMFIKSNNNTIDKFNPIHTEPYKNIIGWDDQVYMNDIKNTIKYIMLPLELFPNGQYYYIHNQHIKPYMIHFNYVIGHMKKEKMIEYNKWYVLGE
jgi:hypothetical protein